MPTLPNDIATLVAGRLAACPGVSAIALGGSFASGTADAESDIDIGLYYRPENPIDLRRLDRLVSDIDDRRIEGLVTSFEEWGPWVNGGAWLFVRGRRVDLLYRDLGRVRGAIEDCRAGRLSTHFQIGHPAGFSPQIYAGEIDLCEPLYDPDHEISSLESLTRPYPQALQRALFDGLWESGFSLRAAERSARRADVCHVVGCAYRAVVSMLQTVFGLNERYWVNEKGALHVADSLPMRPDALGVRLTRSLAGFGTGPETLQRSLQELGVVLDDVERLLDR